MADMTITITVTGRVGTNNITWSRTATVEDLQGAIHKVADAPSNFAGSEANASSASKEAIYSTGMGVVAIVQTGSASLAAIEVKDPSDNAINSAVLSPGIPFIMYNSAGANGFDGGIKNSATATDTPNVNIEMVTVKALEGVSPWSGLAGLKLVS